MKLLFASDVHGDLNAFQKFSQHLARHEYAVGVIAGDLTEYDLTLKEIGSAPGVSEDDLLEELYDPEDTVEDLERRVNEYRANPDTPLAKAVRYKEGEIRKILGRTRKHVILIPGNHDVSEWKSKGRIHNVHNCCFRYKGYRFIGYRYTRLEVSEEQEQDQLQGIERLIGKKTILVTHSPPEGTLDQNYRGLHIGSKPLQNLIANENIYLHLFGHVHYSFGYAGISANGSYVTNNKFISIDLEKRVFEIVDGNP